MALATIAFFVFAATAILAALMVVFSRNPVHAVLWLILAFFSGAGLFVLLGAEFLAMMMLVVYVGAVAVLFLFVVMMLDIDFAELKRGLGVQLPLGTLVATILMVEIGLAIAAMTQSDGAPLGPVSPDAPSNTRALGRVLYDDYVLPFQLSGLVLLVAMIGAIVLVHHPRRNVKRQDAFRQITRTRADSVTLHDMKPGEGTGGGN